MRLDDYSLLWRSLEGKLFFWSEEPFRTLIPLISERLQGLAPFGTGAGTSTSATRHAHFRPPHSLCTDVQG